MPFKFNQELWDIGRKIEDTTLPLINEHYECNFQRNENDIFDILDIFDIFACPGVGALKPVLVVPLKERLSVAL